MSRPDKTDSRCSLCEREVPGEMITLHHLKPREKGGKAEHRTPLCRPCHKQLHAVFSNADLARSLDSIERLRAEPALQLFLKWIRKQKPGRSFGQTCPILIQTGGGEGSVCDISVNC